MPEVNFNLLNPDAALYSGPNVVMDPQKAYAEALAQRQSNMLAQLYAKHYDPQTGGVNYNSLIGEAAQDPVTASAIPTIMGEAQKQSQSMAEIAQKRALQQQEEAETRRAQMKDMAIESYGRLRGVKDIEGLRQWHKENPELEGTNKAERTAKLEDELARTGYEATRARIEQSLQDITGIKPEEIKTAITEADGHRWLINEKTGAKIADLGTASKTGTSVNVGVSTAKGLAETVPDIAKTSRTQALGAVQTMNSANEVRTALNSGLVIAGPTANLQMKWNQLLTEAGKGNPERAKQLAQTRNAIVNLSKLTLGARAQLAGSGAISDFETKLLEKASSGDINDMSVEELQVVADAAQKGAQFLWDEHQGLLETMKSDPETAKLARYYMTTSNLAAPVGRTAPAGGANKAPTNVDDLVKRYAQPPTSGKK